MEEERKKNLETVDIFLQVLFAVLLSFIFFGLLGYLFDSLESQKKLNEVQIEYYQKILNEK